MRYLLGVNAHSAILAASNVFLSNGINEESVSGNVKYTGRVVAFVLKFSLY